MASMLEKSPPELQVQILAKLNPVELQNVFAASKALRQKFDSNDFWLEQLKRWTHLQASKKPKQDCLDLFCLEERFREELMKDLDFIDSNCLDIEFETAKADIKDICSFNLNETVNYKRILYFRFRNKLCSYLRLLTKNILCPHLKSVTVNLNCLFSENHMLFLLISKITILSFTNDLFEITSDTSKVDQTIIKLITRKRLLYQICKRLQTLSKNKLLNPGFITPRNDIKKKKLTFSI